MQQAETARELGEHVETQPGFEDKRVSLYADLRDVAAAVAAASQHWLRRAVLAVDEKGHRITKDACHNGIEAR